MDEHTATGVLILLGVFIGLAGFLGGALLVHLENHKRG